MTMKDTQARSNIITVAVAFALLFAVTNATALTNSAPVAHASPAQLPTTPVVAGSVPATGAGEDIRDIRQPRHLPTPLSWVVASAGVVALLAAALGWWAWLRRKRANTLLPHEIALQHLEAARHLMDPEHAREYCFAVSRIIRNYVEDQLHFHAPRLTTEEFLHEVVEVPGKITETHRPLLGQFLQHCDLAKFAGWRYSTEALAVMHASAIDFVQQSAAPKTNVN